MKTQTDKFTANLESKVFENDGEHLFISRIYTSFDKPKPDTDDINLIEVKEGSFFADVAQKALNDLEAFGQKFFYSPTYKTTKPLFEEKHKELKFDDRDKYRIERSMSEVNEYMELSAREQIKKYPPDGLGFFHDYTKFDIEEEVKKRQDLEDYMSSIGPKYLISDEIRIKITPENLDKYLTVSKKRLEQLNRQQIADWYLYKKSESLEADTEQKQETAVRKRRTDILKFLPSDKPIEDLIGKDALKEGKKNLSERIKKKKELDRGPKIPIKINYPAVIFWTIFTLVVLWFFVNQEEPKSNCERAYEYHKDYQVLEQCRKNTLINDMYDN